MNINTKEEWNNIWTAEGAHTWRIYPCTNNKICSLIDPEHTVMELGCGIGILSYQIHSQGNFVIPVDISETAIKIMKQTYGLTGVVAQIPPIPKMENINVIVASQLLEHFENPEEIIQEMVQICDESIIAVPDNVLGSDECEHHHQKFNDKSMMDLLLKYYEHVQIYKLTDIFMASPKVRIKIPMLICRCWGRRN